MNRSKKVALYLRLSLEDDRDGESDSIKNQRELLYRYLQNHSELVSLEPTEIVDDGFSGTNFLRPGIKQLLEMAQQGEIGCLIVKDFSRFGRNYIEVGDYLERLFPALGIRFIAVNDHYDSALQTTGTGLDMALSNLVYDLYSKDLSEKVKSARRMKMLKGEFTSPFAFFGYQKDANSPYQLTPDLPAAAIIQQIFAFAAKQMRPGEIARQLNAKAIPTPMAYKRQQGCKRNWGNSHTNNFWTKDAVTRILRDERYTGKLICGKQERQIGKMKLRKVPRENWVKIENAYEAVVSPTLFDQAQQCMSMYRPRSPAMSGNGMPRGMVKCESCGYALRRKDSLYFCATGKACKSPACDKTQMSEIHLKALMLYVLQQLSKLTMDTKEEWNRRQNQQSRWESEQVSQIRQCERKIHSLQQKEAKLYETYRLERGGKETYLQQKEQNAAQQKKITEERTALQQNLEKERQQAKTLEMFWEEVRCDGLITAFTPQLAQTVFTAVILSGADRVQLSFSCKSPFFPYH